MLIEKDRLLPFEEAKLYGHNAIHALMAYLGAFRGYTLMSQLREDPILMQIAGEAFIRESGAALIQKHSSIRDELFTTAGFQKYAEDLLERMTNPYLEDTIERAGRDPVRKLGLNDRLFGTMTLCLEQGIEPKNMALGAAAGLVYYIQQAGLAADISCQAALDRLWKKESSPYRTGLIERTEMARTRLPSLINRGT